MEIRDMAGKIRDMTRLSGKGIVPLEFPSYPGDFPRLSPPASGRLEALSADSGVKVDKSS
jgi:hypothetical protein